MSSWKPSPTRVPTPAPAARPAHPLPLRQRQLSLSAAPPPSPVLRPLPMRPGWQDGVAPLLLLLCVWLR